MRGVPTVDGERHADHEARCQAAEREIDHALYRVWTRGTVVEAIAGAARPGWVTKGAAVLPPGGPLSVPPKVMRR